MAHRAKAKRASNTRNTRNKNSDSKAVPMSRPNMDGSSGPNKRIDDRETHLAILASNKLYYRIGEVSELTGVKAHVLRYWETEFRWMAPPKSRSKQRLYRQRDIEFVLLLKRLLWEERYTIAGARQRIQDLGVEDALALLGEPAKTQGAPPEEDATDWVTFRAALDNMRDELVVIRDALQEDA